MAHLDRNTIQAIASYSDWSKEGIKEALTQHVYKGPQDWHQFLRLLFMVLGVGFLTFGVLFFFAYNWADLHKFAKIGLVEGAIVVLGLILLLTSFDDMIKNIILTGLSVLVGVLFAVFGQIYQTGANAYDFFLGWTMAVTVWVLVSRFAPLWTVFIVLVNTTIVLYCHQVATEMDFIYVMVILLVVNSVFWIGSLLANMFDLFETPKWFANLLALTVFGLVTYILIEGVLDDFETVHTTVLLYTLMIYVFSIWYGLNYQQLFYLAIVPTSVLCILVTMIIEGGGDASVLLLVSVFVVGSVTGIIKGLLTIQKGWQDE